MFTWLANYFIGGVTNKVFYIVGGVVVVAWISLTIFLWDSLGNKTEEVGRLEVEVSSVADVNDELNNTITTILVDKEKIEHLLYERNKTNIKLLEEASEREGVINNEEDACLDMPVPQSVIDILQLD